LILGALFLLLCLAAGGAALLAYRLARPEGGTLPGGRGALATHAAGFALAVSGPAALVAVAFATFFAVTETEAGPSLVLFGLTYGFVGAAAVICATLLMAGLPLTWVLASNRMESGWAYPLSGFAAGAGVLVAARLALLPVDPGAFDALPWLVLAGGAPGALCGWLWWHFARRHAQQARRRPVPHPPKPSAWAPPSPLEGEGFGGANG
jgi:hypothetical protein